MPKGTNQKFKLYRLSQIFVTGVFLALKWKENRLETVTIIMWWRRCKLKLKD